MAAGKKVRVAIVGLGFGAEFIPIYQAHPDAEMYAVCRRNKAELDHCGDKFGIKARYTDYNDLLKDPNVDAVHINSPIPDHAAQSIALNIACGAVWIAFWIVTLLLGFVTAMMHFPIGFLTVFLYPLVMIAFFAVWVYCMYKAYQHEKFKLPIIGNMVEGMVK